MGSYKRGGSKSPNIVYNYSYPTKKPHFLLPMKLLVQGRTDKVLPFPSVFDPYPEATVHTRGCSTLEREP